MIKKYLNYSNIKKQSPIVLILLVAAFLRLYRLPEMASFDFDQEYAANFAWSVVKEFPIQLIGQGLSVQGLFMAPLYFYFLVPFFLLFKLHPIGGAVGSVVIGLVTIWAYYYFLSKVFGKTAGLIAALIRTVAFLALLADWSMVPSYGSELMVILTWYCMFLYWKDETKVFIPLMFVFGLYTSIHPILFPFYGVFLLLLIVKRKLPNFRNCLFGSVAFILPVLPLIIFEYFHSFLEIRKLLEFFSSGSASGRQFSVEYYWRLIIMMLGSTHGVFNIGKIPPWLSGTMVILVASVLRFKSHHIWKNSFHLFIIASSFICFCIYYGFMPKGIPEYYLYGPFLIIFIYFAGLLGYFAKLRYFCLIPALFLVYFSITNFKLLANHWSNPSLTSMANKDNVVKEILKKQPFGSKFFVSYIKTPGWDFGFKYFFKLYGRIPDDFPVSDATYTIVTPKFLSIDSIDFSSGNIGVIYPE